jgi:hypothetical protein
LWIARNTPYDAPTSAIPNGKTDLQRVKSANAISAPPATPTTPTTSGSRSLATSA